MPSIATLIRFDYNTPKGFQQYKEEVKTLWKLLPEGDDPLHHATY
jgi:hypothetical protein